MRGQKGDAEDWDDEEDVDEVDPPAAAPAKVLPPPPAPDPVSPAPDSPVPPEVTEVTAEPVRAEPLETELVAPEVSRRRIEGATPLLARAAETPGPVDGSAGESVPEVVLEKPPDPDSHWSVVLGRGLLAFLVVGAPLCVHPGMFDLFDGSKRVLCHTVLALAFFAWSLGLASTPKPRVALGPWHAGFAVFLAAQLPGVLRAINPLAAAEEWLHRLLWLVAFFLASQLYRDSKRLVPLYVATVTGAGLVALLGLIQAGGVDFPSVLPQVAVPAATFGNKNMASEYIALVIPITLWAALVASRTWVIALSAFWSGLFCVFVLYTVTRASWTAVALGVAAMIALILVMKINVIGSGESERRPAGASSRRALLSVGLLVGLVSGLLIVQLSHGLVGILSGPTGAVEWYSVSAKDIVSVGTDLTTYSVTWRFRIWANALALARDHALFGVGLANWKFWYPLYFDEVAVDTDFNSRVQADTPHNDYLHLLGEAGLVGMVGYLVSVLGVLYLVWVSAARGQNARPGLVIAVAGMAIVYTVDAMFSFPVQKSAPTFLLMIWTGALAAEDDSPRRSFAMREPLTSILPYLAALFAVLVFGHELNYFQSERGFKTGYRLVNEGKMYEAWQELRRAHTFRPDNHALSVFAGGVAMELGMLDQAITLNQRALESHPNFTNAHNQLGNAYWRLKRFDEAEASYRKSLEIHAFLLEPLRNLASLMLARHRLPEAIELLETMVKSHAGTVTPQDRLDLAEAHRLSGNFDQSRKIYTPLQQELPGDVRVPYALGEIARVTGQLGEAERQFRRALAISPGNARANLGLTRALEAGGKKDEARRLLETAVSTHPDNEQAQADLAESIRRSGDSTGAIEIYQELLKKTPGNAALHSRLAGIHISRQDLRPASEHLLRAVELDPRRMLDWARLGKLQVENGLLEQALVTFEKALRHDPNDCKILNEMGLVCNRLGRPEKAVDYFLRASALPDVEPEVFYNLGNTLVKLGRTDEAVKALKTFLALWRGAPGPRTHAEQTLAKLTSATLRSPDPSGP